MPGGQERQIRRRIKSVQSTKKITRAMELIAASRIVKAQQQVAAARPYSEQITEVIRNLVAAGVGLDHPLLAERDPVRTVGFVVIAADRGLAGAYNTSVNRAGSRAIDARRQEGQDHFLVTVGRKVESFFRYRGYKVAHAFTGFSEKPSYEDARRVAAPILAGFGDESIDVVDLVYTRFLSAGSQKVTTARLLPLEREAMEDLAAEESAAYEFEPEPGEILERLLPRYVESRVYAALLDAAASEHAARQRAMKSATDNAEELIKGLSIQANKIRQAGITTEIMDIVGGAEALSASR